MSTQGQSELAAQVLALQQENVKLAEALKTALDRIEKLEFSTENLWTAVGNVKRQIG